MVRPIITLTTDFGLRDSYVAEMKGVMLSICPDAQIVDVSHEIEKLNIRMGAFILACAAPSFTKGTIHVAIVDPGVGTKRKPILIQTKQAYFIGPDNGILALAAKKQGIRHVYEITNRMLTILEVSNTFHGRDIFAPTAAHLAMNAKLREFGQEIQRFKTPRFAEVIKTKDRVVGEVIHVDSYGNVVTNFDVKELRSIDLKENIHCELGGKKFNLKLRKTYGEERTSKPFLLIESHGFLEVSMNRDNLARMHDVKKGDKITLWQSQKLNRRFLETEGSFASDFLK